MPKIYLQMMFIVQGAYELIGNNLDLSFKLDVPVMGEVVINSKARLSEVNDEVKIQIDTADAMGMVFIRTQANMQEVTSTEAQNLIEALTDELEANEAGVDAIAG